MDVTAFAAMFTHCYMSGLLCSQWHVSFDVLATEIDTILGVAPEIPLYFVMCVCFEDSGGTWFTYYAAIAFKAGIGSKESS